MSDILDDIVDEIEVKPNNSKSILKWVAGASLTLITLAYTAGKINSNFFGKLEKLEKIDTENSVKIDLTNKRIDKVYDDVNNELIIFKDYENRQHYLIIDYGDSNKELLKKVLFNNATQMDKFLLKK